VRDIIRDGDPSVTFQRNKLHRPRKQLTIRCSICERRIWNNSVPLIEPEDVPEPRQEWTLCKRCHQELLVQLRLSPVRTPLRLRIAIGLVAAERSPYTYAPTRKPLSDRSWIIIMAWGFAIAMVLHLILIVMLATVAGH
jgi:Fe-S oxidoreductase